MRDTIRASSLVQVAETVNQLGGDAEQIFYDVGIPLAWVGEYDRFINYSQLATVIGLASTRLKAPDFPLRLSQIQTIGMTGPVAVLARNATTVEAALRSLYSYTHTYSPAVQITLFRGPQKSRLLCHIAVRDLPYRAHMMDLSLGIITGMLDSLLGGKFRPDAVCFRGNSLAARDAYSSRFGCPVGFGREYDELLFPSSVLDRAVAERDAEAYELAKRYLSAQSHAGTIADQLEDLLPKLMKLRHNTASAAAEALSMHPRTLQRKLAAEETSFGKILDGVRRAIAVELLSTTDLPLSAIASHLGYSEQSSLTRSCQRWFQRSPLSIRREPPTTP